MIKKIKSIKCYHIFQDFIWNSKLDDFKKYNLIYGWNGSGKTTLTKFLRQIELQEKLPDCEEFDIITDMGIINEKNINESTLNLKVFNKNFVEENIFTDSGEITPIFYIGREDIEIKKSIMLLEIQRNELREKKKAIEMDIDNQKRGLEKFCSEKAREIKIILRSAEENKYNYYDRDNFKAQCKTLEKEEITKKILNDEKIDELKLIINSRPKKTLNLILTEFPELKELESRISKLLAKTITASVIEILNQDTILNLWVNQGLSIVKDRNLLLCPFCNQMLPETLIEQLEGHFNNEYKSFLKTIDQTIFDLNAIKKKINFILPSSSDFYDEFSLDYEKNMDALLLEITKYTQFVDTLLDNLNEKRNNPFIITRIKQPAPLVEIGQYIENINSIIGDHNARTDTFTITIQKARHNIEENIVAESMGEYLESEKKLSLTNIEFEQTKLKLEEINKNITDLEIKIIEHRAPAEEINSDLRCYLGHDEIKFKVEGEGYRLSRNGIESNELSEGEKTAVSFIYFLKTLHDKKFDFSNSIIIIDDPISSLDSNSLYNAFSFLKNRTSGIQQLFVFTHNYSFFKEIKNWLISNSKRLEKSSMYMLKNQIVDGYRIAELHPLDDLLKKYNSEYHFLFSLVYKNAHSQATDLKNYYLIPNVSRRLLESFFAFRYPTQIGNYGNQFAKSKISEEKKTRILRYTDANSHSDHIRSDTEGDLSYLDETPQILNDILELIKIDDEQHFNDMISIIKKDEM